VTKRFLPDRDGLDLDRPESWPADVCRYHKLAEITADLIEYDPAMAEALARSFANTLTDLEDRLAFLSLFPIDHPGAALVDAALTN